MPLFPLAKHITGIGLTDSTLITECLERRLSFANTYYHREPKIDLMDATSGADAAYDFIIASEVFEHLPPPFSSGSTILPAFCERMDS